MGRTLSALYFVLVAMLTVLVGWWNIAVHSANLPGSDAEREQVKALLRDLGPGTHDAVPGRMQSLFPEGAAFSYALYGLVNCNVAAWAEEAERSHLYSEALFAAEQMNSEQVRGGFPALLPPGHGIFHAGWSALLNGRLLETFEEASSDPRAIAYFEEQCDTIAATFRHAPTAFPESYNDMAWPADGAVAMAALALHDRILEPRYEVEVERWVSRVRATLTADGGVSHAWDPVHDRAQRSMRGSSMALMCVALAGVDSSFAHEQFTVFGQRFFAERMGVPMITEYPSGHSGAGDVDSGPLILGAGPVAMIVGAGACRVHGDAFHEHEMNSVIDAFGFPLGQEERRYLFGAMPIADLFIAWCRSMPTKVPYGTTPPRFLRFHAWSALLLLLLWTPWAIGRIRSRTRSTALGQ